MERKISTRFSIAGESEYRNAVKGINGELKTLASEMTRTKAEFQNQANSVEALEKKQAILNQQQEKTAQKVAEMRSALENSRAAHEQYGNTLAEQQARTDELKAALEALKTAEGDTTAEQERLTAELERAQEAQDATQRAYDQSQRSVDYWQRSLNYAEGDLFKLNQEVEDNRRYLEEAKTAADGCATSIDQYGKATGEASEASRLLSDLGGQAFGKIGQALAGGSLIGIVGALATTVKDVATEAKNAEVIIVRGTGATGAALDGLNESFRRVLSTAKSGSETVAETLAVLATRLEMTGPELENVTSLIEQFARATGSEPVQAANMVIDLMRKFQLEVEDIPQILDMLTVAGQRGAESALQLGEAASDSAVWARGYGMDLQDLLAMMVAFRQEGVDSGTILRGMRKAYEDVGSSGKTFEQILREIADGTISQAEAVDMFGPKAADLVVALRNGNVQIEAQARALNDSEGAMQRTAKAAETFKDKWRGFWNSLWDPDVTTGSQYTGFYDVVLEETDAAVEAVQERLTPSLAEARDTLTAMALASDGSSESIAGLVEYMTSAEAQALRSVDGYDELVESLTSTEAAMAQLEAEYQKTHEAAERNVNSTVKMFEEIPPAAAVSAQEMLKALQSQMSYMDTYADNLQSAAKRGVNEGLLKSLSDGSTESAAILAGLREATDEEIQELNKEWEKTQEGKETFTDTLTEMQGEFKERTEQIKNEYKSAVLSFNRESEAYANGARTMEGAIRAARERSEALSEAMYQAGLSAGRALRQGMDDGSGGASSGGYSPGGTGSGTDLTGVEGRMDTLQSTIEQGNGPIAFSAITAGVNGELGREKDLRWWSGG